MTGKSKIVHINITFRNTEATDALKNYATEKLGNCLRKFVHHDTEAHVVLKVERNRQIAEITFHTDGASFSCKEESDNLYASIDTLVDTATQQLRKNKEKLSAHH